MLKALFFCGILTVSMSVDLKSEGAAMDITTKKGKQGRKNKREESVRNRSFPFCNEL